LRPLDFQDFITNKGYVATSNFTKMRKALHKAAKRGRASAQCTLAILYLHRYGVPHNLTAAVYWFELPIRGIAWTSSLSIASTNVLSCPSFGPEC
jgi:hypothetical protein